jgi:hypothetical protein
LHNVPGLITLTGASAHSLCERTPQYVGSEFIGPYAVVGYAGPKIGAADMVVVVGAKAVEVSPGR